MIDACGGKVASDRSSLMKYALALTAGFALAVGCFTASQAATPSHAAYVGAQLAPNAKITMDQARAIAMKARPGQITDQELENEGGGSGLRYSFDIKSSGKVYEVGVDAQTGRVLENKAEGPNPD
jgi:uncharacterized membrane protein YkoI